MKFKERQITYWVNDNERFRIEHAYPTGFCAKDTDYWEGDFPVHAFFAYFDEAVAWCEARAKR